MLTITENGIHNKMLVRQLHVAKKKYTILLRRQSSFFSSLKVQRS